MTRGKFSRILAMNILLVPLLLFLLPGFHITSFSTALCAGATMGVLKLTAAPALTLLMLPARILTFGLSSLLTDVGLYYLTAWMIGGLSVLSPAGPFAAAALTAAVSACFRPRRRARKRASDICQPPDRL